ncbi:MAG TPA: hypothetical protein VNB49_15720 [Candidatus Dormibacteraeota bacterium]|nr:hypothetical protein [Candidatus Dormibacteraeota bacterium]
MKLSPIHVASFLLLGLLSSVCQAQDKPKQEDKPKDEVSTTPVKATIVFTEFDADKKTKSLPYTLYINAPDAVELKPGWFKLRVGSRVPVYTGGSGTTGNMTYLDVGTNIDARAVHTPENHFLVHLLLERSWVEGDVLVPVQKPPEATVPDPHAGSFREPIVRQFTSELDLKLREGQTLETTMATDPISGKVMKVEVALSVVK